MARRCKCGCKAKLLPAAKCSDYFEKKGYVNVDHMARHGIAKAEKKKQQEQKAKNVAFKKNFQKTDIKTRKDAAKKWCHEYIRLRDKDKPCVCCGKPLGEDYHAGHFIESGNNPQTRYDEDNIHGQRVDCNYFKGGDSGDYKENLIGRIGMDRVNAVLSKKGGTMKRTAQDYQAIEDYYRDKIKDLD